jgi:HEAT repeat protein
VIRPRCLPLLLPALAAVALGATGCRSSTPAETPRSAGSSGVLKPILPNPIGSAQGERYFRVDTLISQWDAAQAEGRDAEAAALATRVGEEVDADFAGFVAASRGDQGLRAQSLAVKALAFSKDPMATQHLADRLGDQDADLVGNALIALKVRSDLTTPLPPLLKLLRSPVTSHRRFAPLALANVLLARERAGIALEQAFVDPAVTGLVGLVQDRDPVVRLHAAKAFGALRRPEANDLLVLLLKDDHPRIRVAAAAALERIGDARTFPQVIGLLDASDAETRPLVRGVLVSFAGRLQGAPLSPEVVASLGDSPRAWDHWFATRSPAPAPSPHDPVVPAPR